MSYMALYRKWRPDEFQEVKGQEHVVTTLKNQIKHERIGHAYLFCGTRGTGKTTIAKLMAKAVNCENPVDGSPCNQCPSCKAIAAGASMNVVEIDAASNNGVDNIRQINNAVQYSPSQGKYLVYIIDEVHMLSIGAFNALLKTLEEPPAYVIFILATTESYKIPITISSRCQKYDFRRIPLETIADRLEELLQREGISATREAINYVAKAADGSMRDGLSILDQCISFNLGEELTYDKVLETIGAVDIDVYLRLFDAVRQKNATAALEIVDEAVWQGKDLGQLANEFTSFIRNVLVLSMDENMSVDVTADNRQKLIDASQGVSEEQLINYINILQEAANKIAYTTAKRIFLEVAMIKMCKPQMVDNVDGMLARIEQLEAELETQKEALKAYKESGGAGQVVYVQAPEGSVSMEQGGKAELPSAADSSDAIKKNLQEKYPDAEYEDLIQIAKAWKQMSKLMPRLVQSYYLNATVVPGADASTLEIVVADGPKSFMAVGYFERSENLRKIEEQIAELTQLSVHVTFRKTDAPEEVRVLQKDWDISRIKFDDIEMNE